MTKEEEYITNELKQNYEVITMSHSFAVLDKSTKRNYYIVEFLAYMADIYTKSNPIAVVIGNWFREQSDILAKDLNEEIKKIDFSTKTTLEHLEDLKSHFNLPKNKGKFNEYFIKGHLFDYHKITNLKPVLDEIVANLKQTEDIDTIVDRFKVTEPKEIIDYISKYLIDNYMLRSVNPILTDFLDNWL